ncbi:MAG: hypothetical protein ABI379_05290 [Rhodanobacter sp.]
MQRLLQCLLVLLLGSALMACGPPRKSVFPPHVTIQQLVVMPDGQWQLTLRIQNNSYDEMDFNALSGQLQVGNQVPVLVRAAFNRAIPELAGDVITLEVAPTAAMSQALEAAGAKGSSGSLEYQLSGSVTATPEQTKKTRDFEFKGTDWLSPVPGIAHTYR